MHPVQEPALVPRLGENRLAAAGYTGSFPDEVELATATRLGVVEAARDK